MRTTHREAQIDWTDAEHDEIMRLHIIDGLIIGDAMRRVYDMRQAQPGVTKFQHQTEIDVAKVDVNELFKQFAERNRAASIAAEGSRKPMPPVDYEAMEAEDRAQIDRELDPDAD